ncbi:amidohydrolase [Actinopolymorpha sp. B17G11]|uniref:amidohydrolase n=1 Tax=unclassified Actinopolymorpha TaxID=2627063 RepID=UPI0032D9A44D
MDPDEIIRLRRDFHRHAEPAFLEIRTSSIVVARLRGLGIEVRRGTEAMRTDGVARYPDAMTRERIRGRAVESGADPDLAACAAGEGTAVIAEIAGNRPGPTWGVRCDMDALPLAEATDEDHRPTALGFACQDGFMHACGHDGHTAIGLALAARLSDHDFPGRVRILFQPAEEGGRGAAAMIAAGAADGIDRFVAVHLGLGLPSGLVAGGCEGLLATHKLRAVYRGEAAHASGAPEQGRNALVGAASALLNVMALPRYAAADTRLNVGTLHGGDNVNIVPSYAEMTLEARSTDADICDALTARVEAVLRGAAAMHDLTVVIERTGGSTTMTCDRQLVDAIVAIAAEKYGDERAVALRPLGGSDDASLFAREVQGAGGLATYMLVGGGNRAPHHHPSFDIDEASIPVAVDVLEALLRGTANGRTA